MPIDADSLAALLPPTDDAPAPGLRGCTISDAQLTGWGAAMAAELGVTVR